MNLGQFLVVFVVCTAQTVCGANKRIIGGHQASLGEVPEVVALLKKKNNEQFCGGSLIMPTYVLTAAHCMFRRVTPSMIKVMGGDLTISTKSAETRQMIDVKQIIKHPGFDPETDENDYTILQLMEEVQQNHDFHTVEMAAVRPKAGTKCTIAGWGFEDEDDVHGSNHLKVAYIQVVDDATCKSMPFTVIEDVMFCGGVPSGKIDTCFGDSGGPLLCDGKLAGLVSFGEGCAVPGKYGVYADVVAVKDWISAAIASTMSRSLKSKKKAAAAAAYHILSNYTLIIATVLVDLISIKVKRS